jgi:kinesin family protein C1
MEGPGNIRDISEDKAGMIPRAVHQIYAVAEMLQKKGWTYSMEAQFLEIYNETLRDLLSNDGEVKKHEIKHDHLKGQTTVTDATNIRVETPEEVFLLLEVAAKNRAVAATNSNERSSRSHSVFTLRILGVNSVTDETTVGVLNLIDLAGSERLASSGSTGDRLKETQAINKSLSSLGDVIYALSNKDSHIPYRNSKLTYLLQHSLGGNSKTLMFVNVSPLPASLQETLCSLRFATKVNTCQIGTARKQVIK